MTWRGERRKQLPPDWPARRKARLEADGYRCTAIVWPTPLDVADQITRKPTTQVEQSLTLNSTRCTAPATEVHHAVASNDHRLSSLRSLCHQHHQEHTQLEQQAARGYGPTRFRAKTKHPGLR